MTSHHMNQWRTDLQYLIVLNDYMICLYLVSRQSKHSTHIVLEAAKGTMIKRTTLVCEYACVGHCIKSRKPGEGAVIKFADGLLQELS